MRLLIVIKKRIDSYGCSFGLNNSAILTEKFLTGRGLECKTVLVEDNNCIDREVSLYHPTHVLVEALWIVPEKFPILMKLHPDVKWMVRIHSELPFLSNEGIAMEWIGRYQREVPSLVIAANNDRMVKDLCRMHVKCVYLPNLYMIADMEDFPKKEKDGFFDVACFGAIRPMKNQLIQACAAMSYAEKHGLKLRFHINSSRIEQKGGEILKNIRSLFKYFQLKGDYELVEVGWLCHFDFLKYIRSNIDIGLQVSFSETFNIVTADYVTAGVPCVVSNEIDWMPSWTYADTNDISSIVNVINRVLFLDDFYVNSFFNKRYLNKYNERSFKRWEKYFNV